MGGLFSIKRNLELWTNDEFSDFSLSVCSAEHDDNDLKRELIIATDLNANYTNKIGEIPSIDINTINQQQQQYNWQNILEEWISNSNAIPNSKRTQILLEIANGRVSVHPSFKQEKIQNKTNEYQKQHGKTSKAPSLNCRICDVSFTHAYTRRIHEELHNTG